MTGRAVEKSLQDNGSSVGKPPSAARAKIRGEWASDIEIVADIRSRAAHHCGSGCELISREPFAHIEGAAMERRSDGDAERGGGRGIEEGQSQPTHAGGRQRR